MINKVKSKLSSSSSQGIQKKVLATAISSAIFLNGIQTVSAAPVLEEVIVTATRRAQSVQDIPYNISVITADDIEKRGITSTEQLFRSVPGVVFIDQGPRSGVNNSTLILRGLNADGPARSTTPLATAPVVSVYINETPIYATLRLKDIERVEVLRGPQGTLYGSGSLGGSVRYIFNKPDFEKFAGDITGEFSHTENGDGLNWVGDLVLNVPISDTFALRINAGIVDTAGYIDLENAYVRRDDGSPELNNGSTDPFGDAANFVAGQPIFTQKEGTNNYRTESMRIALRWEPTDTLDINFAYHLQDDDTDDSQTISYLRFGDDALSSSRVIEEPFKREVDILSLDVEYAMGFATLTTSVSDYKSDGNGSADHTDLYVNFPFYPGLYGSSPRPLVEHRSFFKDQGTVFEARLASNTKSGARLDWVAGVYYLDQDVSSGGDDHFLGYDDYANACFATTPGSIGPFGPAGGPPCGFGTLHGVFPTNGPLPVVKDLAFVSRQENNFEDLAVFGEITWHVTNRWQITGGMRYFDQEFESTQLGGLVFAPGAVSSATQRFKEDDVLFKFNSSFDINDVTSIYATWSEGFRRGGANGLPPVAPDLVNFGNTLPVNPAANSYKSDRAENREIGIKGTFMDRYRYSFAYFNIDMEDFQTNALCTPLSLLCVLNAGDANSSGVEFEVQGQATDNLEVGFAYSFTDATFDKLSAQSQAFVADGTTFGGLFAGRQLPGTPKHSIFVSTNYIQQLSNGWQLIYGLNGSYRSDSPGPLNAFSVDTDSYTLWNAGITLDTDKWRVRAFVNNIGDERGANARLFGADAAGNPAFYGNSANAWVSTPRSAGLSVSYRF